MSCLSFFHLFSDFLLKNRANFDTFSLIFEFQPPLLICFSDTEIPIVQRNISIPTQKGRKLVIIKNSNGLFILLTFFAFLFLSLISGSYGKNKKLEEFMSKPTDILLFTELDTIFPIYKVIFFYTDSIYIEFIQYLYQYLTRYLLIERGKGSPIR